MVVHPVQHDLRRPVPPSETQIYIFDKRVSPQVRSFPSPGGHVSRHLVLRGPGQPEVEDLQLTVFVHSNVGGLQILGHARSAAGGGGGEKEGLTFRHTRVSHIHSKNGGRERNLLTCRHTS